VPDVGGISPIICREKYVAEECIISPKFCQKLKVIGYVDVPY